ncbi:GTPase domain-containing protein [Paenibacillus ehimensis]|uniref:GTPase domain-containing protein n=1 Tax=Paenibacillus ehimensis TaxID=79264 RepID=UPI003D27A61E
MNLRTKLQIMTNKKIVIIGQPGAGKSSLLDQLTDQACVPRPMIGAQTDLTNWSREIMVDLVNSYKEVVFVDSPGYCTSEHSLASFVHKFPFDMFDKIVMVVSGKVRQADDVVWHSIVSRRGRSGLILVRTYSDSIAAEEEAEVLADLHNKFRQPAILVSNRTKRGIDELKKLI